LKTGLTSITFRQFSVDEVIAVAKRAGLAGIEWGGDIHVPSGNFDIAGDVRKKTEEAGLSVTSYGSYYRCEDDEIQKIIDTAEALGAPVVRVWAGVKGSAETTPEERTAVILRLRRMVDEAGRKHITIALEYHVRTLTDTQTSAHQLLQEVNRPGLKLYWQPRPERTPVENCAELAAAFPFLTHIHLFHWLPLPNGTHDRRPLADGEESWKGYLKYAADAGFKGFFLFEFIKGNDPDQLMQDSSVLREWLTTFVR
jgi:3-dehydroshikimate dehydratase